MLTQEQIKNLKPGDHIVIHTTFANVDKTGNIWFNAPALNCALNQDVISPSHVSLPSEHGTSVPTPKYDPTRPFKKGDKVSVDADLNEEVLTVAANQLNSSVTATAKDGQVIVMPCYFLKLIIPVEELNPYCIDPENSNVLFKHGKKFATFEDDDEAQELCDRLNAEWRKGQNK